MESLGIGDTAYFGPEAEFFIFEDVKIDVSMNRAMYALDSVEGPYNSARKYEEGNLGHRPGGERRLFSGSSCRLWPRYQVRNAVSYG